MQFLAKSLVTLLLATLAYLNYQLFYSPRQQPIDEEVVQQLTFLRGALRHDAGQQMQELYPEGFVYLNSLYALTWIELLPRVAPHSALGREARTEARWALREIQSPVAQSIFDEELPLPRGAFYQGWSAYVLGRYLAALPRAERDSADIENFEAQCALIAAALQNSPTPYLESYAGAAWPADGVMGVAALAWHDRLQSPRYQALRQQWLKNVDRHLDKNQLVPHAVQAGTGAVLEAARGSSQSQLLNFLCEIDSGYAQAHFRRYRNLFLTHRLGLPGIREAARGAAPVADVDSGPVIWDVGGAASLVGRRTMERFGDTTTAVGIRNSVEAFGLPWHGAGGKYYLLGQLPIADAFIAWSNSYAPDQPLRGSVFWRTSFQLLSLGLVMVVLVPFVRTRVLRRKPQP